MNKKLLLFAFACIIASANAQTNRRDTKKSIPYRANYQRIGKGCNSFHTLEIKNGTLWAWGVNYYGELGVGDLTNRKNPVQVGTDNKWVITSSGQIHSLGLKSDGTLWAWGDNEFGQLGLGDTINRNIPTQIGTDNKWISISAVTGHSPYSETELISHANVTPADSKNLYIRIDSLQDRLKHW